MEIFREGEYADDKFPTSVGDVGTLAIVHIVGSTLELQDAAVYVGGGQHVALGVRGTLEIARQVEQLAKLQGFTEGLITGQRLSGAASGRPVYLRRRVR